MNYDFPHKPAPVVKPGEFVFAAAALEHGHIYVNVAAGDPAGEQLLLADEHGEKRIACAGRVGFPFFGQLILDVLNRTETAMTQAHAFKAAELSLLAQAQAKRLTPRGDLGSDSPLR